MCEALTISRRARERERERETGKEAVHHRVWCVVPSEAAGAECIWNGTEGHLCHRCMQICKLCCDGASDTRKRTHHTGWWDTFGIWGRCSFCEWHESAQNAHSCLHDRMILHHSHFFIQYISRANLSLTCPPRHWPYSVDIPLTDSWNRSVCNYQDRHWRPTCLLVNLA